MQQHSAVLVGEESIPGHVGSNTICVAWAQHQSQEQESAWRPRSSLPALDNPMGCGGREAAVLTLWVQRELPLGQSPLPQSCDFVVLPQTGGQHSR